MTIDQDRLERVCRRADELLWAGYVHSFLDEGSAPAASHAAALRIVFPLKGSERRVGRQEARLAFVAALVGGDPADGAGGGGPAGGPGGAPAGWGIAVETPTRLSYRMAQRGPSPKAQRGLHDLALFRHDDTTPELVVEFESGGRSGHAARDENLTRDMATILAEPPDALWFHVLRGANSASLPELLGALDAAISTLSNPLKLGRYAAAGKQVMPRAKTIAFHVCLLNPDLRASLHRVLDYVPGKPVRGFFAIETRGAGEPGGHEAPAEGAQTEFDQALEIADGGGWAVFRGE